MSRVKCAICGQTFDKDKVEWVPFGKRYHAHKQCIKGREQSQVKHDIVMDALRNNSATPAIIQMYCQWLFGQNVNHGRVGKQITEFVEKYNMSLSGIIYTLYWYYELQENPINSEYDTIGIVPYIYKQAQRHYKKITYAETVNYNAVIENKSVKVTIHAPKRKIKLIGDD